MYNNYIMACNQPIVDIESLGKPNNSDSINLLDKKIHFDFNNDKIKLFMSELTIEADKHNIMNKDIFDTIYRKLRKIHTVNLI